MAQASISSPIDIKDVQGDVILGIPKRFESFVFFTLAGKDKVKAFKHAVGSNEFLRLITSTADIDHFRQKVQSHKAQSHEKPASLIPFAAVNIAFTQPGLMMLGLTDDIGDDSFKAGQLKHAKDLGDSGTTIDGVFQPDWLKEFKSDIHGVILIGGDCERSINEAEEKVISLLGSTIKQVLKVSAKARPGPEKGHEHFGYMDGISSPAVKGVVTPFPGQQVVDPGVILMGQDGDPNKARRPSWAKNGSILVYRQLQQLVPELDKFKHDNPLHVHELGVEKGAELLGSRMFGRWKSGAPIDITPTQDDPVLARDPKRNNNFDYSKTSDQSHCPFSAHIRKTNPRSDLGSVNVAPRSIIRAGLPYGPEVTDSEHRHKKTEHDRGLAFVCYQSTLANGFEFMQMSWANNPSFIFGKKVDGKDFKPGFDPIIGQNGGDPNGRVMGGFDSSAQANNITLPMEFVHSKGGAYFFSPSITVIKNKIGNPA